jgi:cytochrome P450
VERRPTSRILANTREIRFVIPLPSRQLPFSNSGKGKFVRFGPNSLSVNSASALHKIYGFHSNVQKSEFYSAFPPTKDTFNTHSSIDKAAHARKRRVLSHAFSDTAIKVMEKYILQNMRSFTHGLGASASDEKKGWSRPQNMADWCNYLTFDIMGDLCFGKAFGMLEREENRFAIDLIGNAAHRHLIVCIISLYP